MRRLALSCLALVACGAPSRASGADEEDLLAGLKGSRALELATTLAADDMKGRRSGTASGKTTEEWILNEFGSWGVHPADPAGSYLHEFQFSAPAVASPIGLSIGETAATYGTDFVDLLYTGTGSASAEVVFVGYGLVSPERKVDDYAGLDVKGKIVLAVDGAPAAQAAELVKERALGAKTALAADRGAVGFLLCEGPVAAPASIGEASFRAKLPAVSVSAAIADRLLAPADAKPGVPVASPLAEWKKAREAGSAPGRATGTKARLEVNGTLAPGAEARNVLGGWYGRDYDLRQEVILVGAHHDHLGADVNGRPYNGADDNASGAATILALIETLQANGFNPKRSVYFAWFGAGEQGCAGSRALAEELPFQNSDATTKIVAMIEVRRTGLGNGAIRFGGGASSPEMSARVRSFLPKDALAAMKPADLDEATDHASFQAQKVPSFVVSIDGDHPNHRGLADDATALKAENLEAAARFVGRIVVGLANEEAPAPPK